MNFSKIKMFYICTDLKNSNTIYKMFMYRYFSLVVCLLLSTWLGAQRHEIGIRLGSNSLVGDIGRTNYILQKPFTHSFSEHGVPVYVGVMYRLNFNPYQTFRFDLGYGSVQFDDAYAKENYRRQRGFWGTNSGVEANALFEYNFLPVNNEQKALLSPYVFGGIGGLFYNQRKATFSDLADEEPDISYSNKLILAVPFGIGLKYKFNYNWALSGELMFKPTFSDGIDYSTIDRRDVTFSSAVDKEASELKRDNYVSENTYGNTNSKDWINSVTLSLTYSFGRPPCYCD